ncbi:MAG: histidine kinase [Burkholderiaceae bacterium]|nr:histidine kinase [Burkholderiaceae bacterium]
MTPMILQNEAGLTSASQPESTARAYWICQALGWGGYVAILLLMSLIYNDGKGSLAHRLLITAIILSVAVMIGLILTHSWRKFIQRRGWVARTGGLPVLRLMAGILVLTVIQMSVVTLAYVVVYSLTMHDVIDSFHGGMPWVFVGWLGIYTVWTVIYVATVSRRHTRRMEIEKLQLELHVKDAELRALQAQVNPHFFFNSLNSIRALIYQDAQAAAEVIDRLASMMRYSLQSGRIDTVPLAQELKAVHDYLAIEKIRFEDRLLLSESVDPQLEGMALPPMILQTLVENAVKYGVELSMEPCELRISAQRHGEQMQLSVSNQGRLREVAGSTKVGVRNASKRLALLFGANAGVDLFERDGWVTARLSLPCQLLAA